MDSSLLIFFVKYLCDGESVIKVTERVKLPLLPLDSYEELFDAFQGQLITLDQDPDGVGHKLGCHLQDLVGQGGGEQHNLRRWGKISAKKSK